MISLHFTFMIEKNCFLKSSVNHVHSWNFGKRGTKGNSVRYMIKPKKHVR